MILSVVKAGWLNLRRDRAALMLSFAVPIVFFSIFAGIFGAQRSHTPRTAMAVADEDRTPQSKHLIEALQKESALKLVLAPKDGPPFDAARAEEYVRGGDAPVALVIPKGFGATKIRFGGPGASSAPSFRILTDSADPIAQQVASGLLQKVVMTSTPEMMMDAGADAFEKMTGGLTPEQRQSIDANMRQYRQYLAQPEPAKPAASENARTGSSPGTFVKIETTDIVGQNKSNVVVALYAAGIGVMFLLFTASGTLDRILTTRLTLTRLLLGKLAYLWTLGVVQLIVMFVWGAVAFKLDLVHHIPGFLLMTAATALATSAFGLLLASVARSRAQLGAISTLTVLTVSALGGSMFPRFLMPEGLQKAGLVLFNAWALDGFTNVFWREEPLTSIVLPVLVLLGWTVVFFVAARQLTRRWEIA
jgi:ABC-2 type transport system permease protein